MQRIHLFALMVLLGAGCSLGLSPRGDVASGRPTARAPARKSLPGVDLSKLDEREHAEFWEAAGSIFAPCPGEAVPVGQCVEEARPCSACRPMAQLVADQVAGGATKTSAKAAALARFGAEPVKDVPVRDSPAKGPANAPVTIVVFSDFQCPSCKAAMPLLAAVQKKNDKQVRLVHKFYPLSKHLRARDAAYAAIAAMKQGKYWAMEELIFDNQEALADQDLERYAAEIGLDLDKFRADRAAADTKAIVDRDIQDGDAAGLTGTPFIFVNGRLFDPAHFRLDRDLERWVATEIELVGSGSAAPRAKAAE